MKVIFLLTLAALPAVRAQDSIQRFALHGFWAYGFSNRNNFSYARKGGEFDNAGVTGTFTSSRRYQAQFEAQVSIQEVNEQLELRLDHVYASYQHDERLRFNIGAVPQPFGIYGGKLDIGTDRPFLDLPQSIYGPSGIVARNYKGLGLEGKTGGLRYHVYGGELVRRQKDQFEQFLTDSLGPDVELEGIGDVLGLFAEWRTPHLCSGVSAYSGQSDRFGRIGSIGGHAIASIGSFDIRIEVVRTVEQKVRSALASFSELTWKMGDQWGWVGRVDYAKTRLRTSANLPDRSLLRHFETAAGIHFRPSAEIIFKLSVHRIDGNFYAVPKWVEEGTMVEDLRHVSYSLMAGMQFSLR